MYNEDFELTRTYEAIIIHFNKVQEVVRTFFHFFILTTWFGSTQPSSG